jgi:PilZ domain
LIKDSRQFPRYPVDLQVSVSAGKRQLSARTRDLSRSGLCLVSGHQIPLETRIEIRLVLSFAAGGHSEPLILFGRVVWCTALFGAFQIGVMFVDLDLERARHLQMLVAILDGSPSEPADEEDTDRHGDPDDPFRP